MFSSVFFLVLTMACYAFIVEPRRSPRSSMSEEFCLGRDSDTEDDTDVRVIGAHRMNMVLGMDSPCVAIFSGPFSLTTKQKDCLLSYSGSFSLGDTAVSCYDLLSCWIDVLADGKIPAREIFVPGIFKIDMALYFTLVEITGLRPFNFPHLDQNIKPPEKAKFTKQNDKKLDLIRKNNYLALSLVDYVKNFYNSKTSLYSKTKHSQEPSISNGVSDQMVVCVSREKDLVFFCPYYPGISYEELKKDLICSTDVDIEQITPRILLSRSGISYMETPSAPPLFEDDPMDFEFIESGDSDEENNFKKRSRDKIHHDEEEPEPDTRKKKKVVGSYEPSAPIIPVAASILPMDTNDEYLLFAL